MPLAPSGYKFYRNVKDYGATGDGSTDDTAAINSAVTDGNRCGRECGSTTTLGALIYFPVRCPVLAVLSANLLFLVLTPKSLVPIWSAPQSYNTTTRNS